MKDKRCGNCEHSIVYMGCDLICTNKNSPHRSQYVETTWGCDKHKEVVKER